MYIPFMFSVSDKPVGFSFIKNFYVLFVLFHISYLYDIILFLFITKLRCIIMYIKLFSIYDVAHFKVIGILTQN